MDGLVEKVILGKLFIFEFFLLVRVVNRRNACFDSMSSDIPCTCDLQKRTAIRLVKDILKLNRRQSMLTLPKRLLPALLHRTIFEGRWHLGLITLLNHLLLKTQVNGWNPSM